MLSLPSLYSKPWCELSCRNVGFHDTCAFTYKHICLCINKYANIKRNDCLVGHPFSVLVSCPDHFIKQAFEQPTGLFCWTHSCSTHTQVTLSLKNTAYCGTSSFNNQQCHRADIMSVSMVTPLPVGNPLGERLRQPWVSGNNRHGILNMLRLMCAHLPIGAHGITRKSTRVYISLCRQNLKCQGSSSWYIYIALKESLLKRSNIDSRYRLSRLLVTF